MFTAGEMPGSEAGVITSREPFVRGLQSNPVASQPPLLNMRLAFGADGMPVYKPPEIAPSPHQSNAASSASATVGPGDMLGPSPLGFSMSMGTEPKKKRGRPRRYGSNGGMSLALIPGSQDFKPGQPATSGAASPNPVKKARGRPPGSGKKHLPAWLGSTGHGFTPYVITVKAGEDVSAKIMAFSQQSPRTICILSANGVISNVTLRQPAMCGGTVTFEGRFEILSLSGSFLLTEVCGHRSRIGGLSVSLSGPDGRILGGGVAGLLTAATPVQVVVGTFISDDQKDLKSPNRVEPSSASPKLGVAPGLTGSGSTQSRGTPSESSEGGPTSPLNQSTGACNNTNFSILPWN